MHDFYQEPQVQEYLVVVYRYLLDNLEKPQIKEFLSKVMDERQIAILPKAMKFSDETLRVEFYEYLAAAKARGLSAC